MSTINVSTLYQPFSTILWGLDYVPFVSAGKGFVDFFATRYWNPENFDQSPYAKSYFDHLAEKENSRYIAVIPFFGNSIVIIQDCYDAVIKQEELRVLKNAEQGDSNAIEKLYQGTPEQKAKAFEYCYKAALDPSYKAGSARRILFKIVCGKEGEEKKQVLAWLLQNLKSFDSLYYDDIYNKQNLPQELRTKIVDLEIAELLGAKTSESKYGLHRFLKKVSVQDKTRAMGLLMKAAEAGNKNAFSFLKLELVFNRSLTSSFLQWVTKQAETLSSPGNLMAWEYIKDEYYSSKSEFIIASYLKMLQIPQLPKDRFSYIVNKLDVQTLIGTPAEKTQILAGYLKAAESGNVKMMYKVARLYQTGGQLNNAVPWFDKAAHANHLSSILAIARICANRGDINGAAFWLNKAKGRCYSASKRYDYSFVEMCINHARRFGQGAGFGNRGRAENDSSERTNAEARQRAHQKAEEERAQARRARAQKKEAETAAIKAELTQILGEFSSAAELQHKWRRWSLKTHPDVVKGREEEFKRVTNLVAAYKAIQGWPP